MKHHQRVALAAGCAAGGGIALVSTLTMRWVTSGPGSTLVGHRLAQALRSLPGRHRGWGDAAGIGLYVVAALGCVALATCWVRRPVVVLVRAVVGAVPLAVLAVLLVRGTLPFARWGTGAIVASAGGLLLVAPPFLHASTTGSSTGSTTEPTTEPRDRT